MSHPVDRLKELLFDAEAQALSDVQRRLLKSEADHAAHTRERELIADRLETVFSRAGTEERFRASVATVIDGALRRAETERHAELSEAMAPLVVRTIRAEIVNSRDEMVEALYPITGRLVKAYVASAISDLAAQINRKVEHNPVMLRLRSLLTGKSVAELVLADNGAPQVEEVYLIRRGTGQLLGNWPEASGSNANHAMSGVLAAINEFASDVFGDSGPALRQIDMGSSRVYLRASPLYLLAARCSGSAPASAEQTIDDAFLSTIERAHAAAQSPEPPNYRPLLMGLTDQLSSDFAERAASQRTSQMSPFIVLLSLIGAVVAAVVAWNGLDRYFTARAHAITEATIADTPGTKGYLIDIDVASFGRRVSVTGLTQDNRVKVNILERLRQALPGASIVDHLAPLPGAHGEIGPAIENAAVSASLDKATERLQRAGADLPAIIELTENSTHRDLLKGTESALAEAVKRLQDPGHALLKSRADQNRMSQDLRRRASELSTIVAGNRPASGASDNPPSPRNIAEAMRQIELAAEQLATVTTALLQATAARSTVPKPTPAPSIVRAPDITAFERLAIWVRSHAVFFSDDLTYRDEPRTTATLDELARLMRETEALVRVIGYTDAKGSNDRNTALSGNRARKVVDALVSRGVPSARLVAVGRQDANQITADIGEASFNRRVEFELGFDGEGAP
jgi:outer membrane protein OmpA-like peptidoglycan-associated protein